ncbi:hypothetical protein JKY72_02805 [Candidatus Gracilibacteria bacterium]|nr:hypothetical protein [Candidatus Gracilibacteria bacterium]
MDFAGAVNYEDLKGFKQADFSVEKVQAFVDEIDLSKVKFVHVAGSKGKGSVSTFVQRYLTESGFKTGLFTSPWIEDERECISIDGEWVSEGDFASLIQDLESEEGDLTHFEMLVVMALRHFVHCDFVVLEVGIGGRDDATNVISPELSILTRVEKEHSEILGESLSEILDHKLGIFEDAKMGLVGEQSAEVVALVKEKLPHAKFVHDFGFDENENLAFGALEMILGRVDRAQFEGLNFRLVGRQDRRENVVFDVAHTPSSVNKLLEYLGDGDYVFLLSLMRDKEVDQIVELLSKAGRVVFANAHDVRGVQFEEAVEDVFEAYLHLKAGLKKDQVLVVTGSHFLVSKILKQLSA